MLSKAPSHELPYSSGLRLATSPQSYLCGLLMLLWLLLLLQHKKQQEQQQQQQLCSLAASPGSR